jgi:hypothetical protein
MKAHPVTWALRLLVVVLPLVAGDVVGDALADHSTPVARAGTAMAWAAWAILVGAAVVPHPVSLTALRIVAPAVAVGSVWALVNASDPGALDLVGVAVALCATVVALSGWVADDCVNARSYGDERRFSLRTPATLLFGPAPLAVALCVAGVVVPVLLLAARQWVAGAVTLVVGLVVARFAAVSVHTLATRFVVLVPAGMTLVDPLALVESVLFARARIRRLGPALVGTSATDLSQNAPGLAVEVDVDQPVGFALRTGRRTADEMQASGVVFTPSRAAALLDEAARRGVRVG